MAPIAAILRRPAVAPIAAIVLAGLLATAPHARGDDLGDELHPLHGPAVAPTLPALLDPFAVPAQDGELPQAAPPPAASPVELAPPAPTTPGAFFERPALAAPTEPGVLPPGEVPTPGGIADPPISYLDFPSPGGVQDIEYRDGPRIPEPMVFDLIRGLGARRGELEFNVLSIVPSRPTRRPRYEWAPEVEWAPLDGFALEFELPILNTSIEYLKFAAQYTIGTAFDDAFIHGVQGLIQYDLHTKQWSPTALYLAGIRLDKTWSLFGMFGFSEGPLVFPFPEVGGRRGLDLIANLSIFANLTEDLVFGVETNTARRMLGSGDFLIMPQIHWSLNEHMNVQFGYGLRDTGLDTYGELGFRVIFER